MLKKTIMWSSALGGALAATALNTGAPNPVIVHVAQATSALIVAVASRFGMRDFSPCLELFDSLILYFLPNAISQTRRGEAPELSVVIWFGFFTLLSFGRIAVDLGIGNRYRKLESGRIF